MGDYMKGLCKNAAACANLLGKPGLSYSAVPLKVIKKLGISDAGSGFE